MSKPWPDKRGIRPAVQPTPRASVPLRAVKPSSGGDRQALTWKFSIPRSRLRAREGSILRVGVSRSS
jgi:hypothetical protein